MCIIALKPAGAKLSDETIRNMWDNNDDGAGIMYADRGKVRIVKGLMNLEDFKKAYQRIGNHRKMVMHFRIKTHGAVSAELTHPFWIRKGSLAMVHNGIITLTSDMNIGNESDTSIYAKVLAHRYDDPREALRSETELQRITSEIGWSKLVFLDGNNEHIIVNEKSGDWVDGCWFSNSSHKSSYKRWSYSRYTSSYNGGSYYNETDDYVWHGTTSTSNNAKYGGSGQSGFMFGESEVTKPYESSKNADDAEWDALIARYEAKYGGL